MLTTVPHSLQSWVNHFAAAPVPVLPATAATIDALARVERSTQADEGQDRGGEVTASELAGPILADPLMTVKLLAHVAKQRARRVQTGSETVTQALLMMGTTRFFRTFENQPTVDRALAAWPAAASGLDRVLRRSHRAARLALAFAVHRKEPDAEVIHEAALMHDFAEALLWCHAPGLALDLEARQAADRQLRSADAQRAVLGIELAELEHALLEAWRLPELLVRITDDRAVDDRQAKIVIASIRLARHAQHGWGDPALPDDYAMAGEMLGLTPAAVEHKVRELVDDV
ncbi:MAG: HDOD domain-containing protein [Lautropia sp.]